MLSRKHYREIASILSDIPAHTTITRQLKLRLVSEFADWLRRDNPRFDRTRFVEAALGDETDDPADVVGG